MDKVKIIYMYHYNFFPHWSKTPVSNKKSTCKMPVLKNSIYILLLKL